MTKTRKRRNFTHRRTAAEISEGAELVPPSVVAKHIGFTPRSVINATVRGDIPHAIKLGRSFRYRLSDVLKALS